jgi:hypothetical protein
LNPRAFLVAFLRHRGIAMGSVLLRDLLGTPAGREQKTGRIREILDPRRSRATRSPAPAATMTAPVGGARSRGGPVR